jgi:GTP-dependent phosphoenolpyruvate carboxykinase
MLILRLTNPRDAGSYHRGISFRCGKTNLAMLRPTIAGWNAKPSAMISPG